MKNIIEYYYNLRIDELHNNNDVYNFDLNNNHFTFKPYTDNIDKSYDIYKLNTIISNKLNIEQIYELNIALNFFEREFENLDQRTSSILKSSSFKS